MKGTREEVRSDQKKNSRKGNEGKSRKGLCPGEKTAGEVNNMGLNLQPGTKKNENLNISNYPRVKN